jgi:DNA-binding NarL/FixJ family response regulator
LGLPLIPRRPLSPRERQILDLVRSGHTQKEVAYRLGRSDATVRVLYARAMRKLGRPKRPLNPRHMTPEEHHSVAAPA